MHLTGRYPDWWKGSVFDRPVRMWAAGVTGESTRDNPQRMLVGPPQQQEAWGTGTIPEGCDQGPDRWRAARGRCARFDRGAMGRRRRCGQGESVLSFKSYEKGREKWQGETLHGVWFDEEPPLDIYSEGLTRTEGDGRDRDRDVHAAAGHERGGEAVPGRGGSDAAAQGVRDLNGLAPTRSRRGSPHPKRLRGRFDLPALGEVGPKECDCGGRGLTTGRSTHTPHRIERWKRLCGVPLPASFDKLRMRERGIRYSRVFF